jgi:NAD-dependent dihydropyrimidine dehydrogenase PreA subunit
MKIIILLHSTTGNTKLVARYAAGWLRNEGHECVVHDVTREKEPPAVDQFDLLGVACPTTYFRPSYVMERYVLNLPRAAARKPAFLLGTAGGDPGSHFTILADALALKGYVALGAHWMVFPNNWPVHRFAVQRFHLAEPLGALVTHRYPKSRPWLGTLWPDLGVFGREDVPKLERFLDGMVARATSSDLRRPPNPKSFHRGSKLFALSGLMIGRREMETATAIFIDRTKCSACGTCVNTCPVGCITRSDDDSVPTVGNGCTGCWSCFNHCPDGAIGGWNTPPGRGRYRGPSTDVRSLLTLPASAEKP